MRKILLGALIGAAVMYYLDPIAGSDRRRKLSGRWADQKDSVLEAARSTAGTVTSVSHGVGDRLGDVGGEAKNTNGQVTSGSPGPRGGAKS